MTNQIYSLSTPFADELPKPPITMGRDFNLGGTAPTAEMSPEQIFQAFVDLAEQDPKILHRLAAKFKYRAPFKESKPITGLPINKLKTVEIGIDDKGEEKTTKRVRPDREALRFSCAIQVTTPSSSQVSLPCWTGRAQFRSPARMTKDVAVMLTKKLISKTHHDWLVSDIIPLALANDQMIGCIRVTTEGQGTPHADRQVILVDRAGLEAHNLAEAMLISNESGNTIMASLPRFDNLTSKGKALGGGFVMQSRGSRGGDKLDWRTGDIQVAA